MARNDDMPIDKEESSGGFERILLILIPAIFTIVLLGALAVFFRSDVRDGVLDFANKIPIVKDWVPDPVLSPEEQKLKEAKEQEESAEATIAELKKQLAEREEEIAQLAEEKEAEASKVQQLESRIETMENQAAAVEPVEEDDEYTKQIRELAKLYAGMSPSKAAPIMQNLTLEEMVLMLSEMKSADRSAILQRMDPKVAADATMMLKDAKPSEDLAIAALQSRLDRNESQSTQSTSANLDQSQLNQTFAGMTPANAADLLMQIYKISPGKAITILNSVNDATRSRILDAMSQKDAEVAARVLNRLMGSN
ncbi:MULTISPECIES: MotE family protein [Paenibacillus]|uniref:Kinesin n=1 Tax=Paenibacillus campinasensis TaxID=66347 RepID=A0ABW9T0G9_9BACL|nr:MULTISPECIES: kinesin [Paenibacillus]MUG66759.1 kinesin [Paenibacillus campinasensis]PAK54618.1 kinesin [Paenibacillus sp. 7541]